MTTNNEKRKKRSRLWFLFIKVFSIDYIPRYTRLAGDIASYKPILEMRIAAAQANNDQWAQRARELIGQAETFLQKLKIDEGWKALHTAKRLEIYAMKEEERLAVARETILSSSKLNEWRRNTILNILGALDAENPVPPSPEVLMHAVEIKDEHFNNQYYKNTLSRSMFKLLFALLFIFFVFIVIYFRKLGNQFDHNFTNELALSEYIIGILLFGFMGAITSAILFTRYNSQYSRITEISSNSVITLSKVFVGAAFSVFIFLLLRSSLLQGIQIFSFSANDPLDFFAIAFVSGFSERLAQKAIEAIVGKESEGK
ncbi:MAG: hypothetical protein ACOCX0_03210 [Bacteroidota bacterium]